MLDPLILKSLAVHRMGISRPIAQVANKTFEVNPGSSFPALHGMAGLPASGVNRRPSSRQILSSDQDWQEATPIRIGKMGRVVLVKTATLAAIGVRAGLPGVSRLQD